MIDNNIRSFGASGPPAENKIFFFLTALVVNISETVPDRSIVTNKSHIGTII